MKKIQHCKSVKIQKKIKKKSGEGGCLRMYWHRGGGYTCNTLQRSFDSLQTALVRAIQDKDQARRHIAKMKKPYVI